jgi:polysaccharide deacetylase family protein (PEP-CTERM system associated)
MPDAGHGPDPVPGWLAAMTPAPAEAATVNAMTIDVEDYFQVEAFAGTIPRTDWETLPGRVEANTDRLLALLAETGARATFFTLGWIAERHPALIHRIVAGGHELASHGLDHTRADRQDPAAFRADIARAKAILEDKGGVAVTGYRAATFSIGRANPWCFEILAETGHRYGSSVHPIRHDLYGLPGGPRFAFRPVPGVDFLEIPVTTTRLGRHTLACGGGGHFRLLPYALTRAAFRRVNRVEHRPGVFYLHPWEIDPAQPRPPGLPPKSRLRHYLNLGATEGRLARFLRDFRWDRLDRIAGVIPLPAVTK